MKRTAWIILGLVLVNGRCVLADPAPEVVITNRALRVRLHLPDANTGFYRGTRFDWSGVIAGLEYAGHEYYPPWFQRGDPGVLDFIYEGGDIVAGPCTAITGPAEEFSSNGKGLGFDQAKAGGTFLKIGVGVLRRPDDKDYSPYRLYPIKDGGQWTVTHKAGSVEFRHVLADPLTGYAYDARKTVALAGNKPRMRLDHVLRNTGARAIQTSVYNHNFLFLDRQPPGPDVSLRFPFAIRASQSPAGSLADLRGDRLTFSKTLAGEDRVYLELQGFGADSKDYDFRIENRKVGAGVRMTANRPLARMALWAIRAPLSLEPFIEMNIKPGAEFAWRITYDYYDPEGWKLVEDTDGFSPKRPAMFGLGELRKPPPGSTAGR